MKWVKSKEMTAKGFQSVGELGSEGGQQKRRTGCLHDLLVHFQDAIDWSLLGTDQTKFSFCAYMGLAVTTYRYLLFSELLSASF